MYLPFVCIHLYPSCIEIARALNPGSGHEIVIPERLTLLPHLAGAPRSSLKVRKVRGRTERQRRMKDADPGPGSDRKGPRFDFLRDPPREGNVLSQGRAQLTSGALPRSAALRFLFLEWNRKISPLPVRFVFRRARIERDPFPRIDHLPVEQARSRIEAKRRTCQNLIGPVQSSGNGNSNSSDSGGSRPGGWIEARRV